MTSPAPTASTFSATTFTSSAWKAAHDASLELGPVLGAYHPVIAYNVRRLRGISGLDEVSFHMSGTEAVMQAVRLARYHTGRSHLVRFCGSYHGWWGDVQPGIGNPIPAHETYTLKDMSEELLHVLRRRKNIACVLVNPLQALHPNRNAPGDSSLVDSGHAAQFNREAYTHWLKKLRMVCTEHRIVLIFDEVFVGFRLAPAVPRSTLASRRTWSSMARRWAGFASRRSLWPQDADEALQGRPSGRHLFRPRDLQFAPVCHGRDA